MLEAVEKTKGVIPELSDDDQVNQALKYLAKAEMIKALKSGDTGPLDVLTQSGIHIPELLARADNLYFAEKERIAEAEERARTAETESGAVRQQAFEEKMGTQMGMLAKGVQDSMLAFAEKFAPKSDEGVGSFTQMLQQYFLQEMMESRKNRTDGELNAVRQQVSDLVASIKGGGGMGGFEQQIQAAERLWDHVEKMYESRHPKSSGDEKGLMALGLEGLKIEKQFQLDDTKHEREVAAQNRRTDVISEFKDIVKVNLGDFIGAVRDWTASRGGGEAPRGSGLGSREEISGGPGSAEQSYTCSNCNYSIQQGMKQCPSCGDRIRWQQHGL